MIASTEPSQSLPAERLLVPYVGFQPDLDNSYFSNQLIIYDFNCRKGVVINLSGQRHVLDCVGSDGMNGKHSGLLYFPLSNHWVCVCVWRFVGGRSLSHFCTLRSRVWFENHWKHAKTPWFHVSRWFLHVTGVVVVVRTGSVSNQELIHQAIWII